jgi:hypothetical protein
LRLRSSIAVNNTGVIDNLRKNSFDGRRTFGRGSQVREGLFYWEIKMP